MAWLIISLVTGLVTIYFVVVVVAVIITIINMTWVRHQHRMMLKEGFVLYQCHSTRE